MTLTAAVSVALLLLTGCSPASNDTKVTDGIVFATWEPDHLTPGRQTLAYDQAMSIFAPLVSIKNDGELEYVQAESVTSEDATTWTIHLRAGWTFHNGEPVTAKSYADAWNYTAYGPHAWENSGELASIVGYSDLNPKQGKPEATTMSGLTVVDNLTLRVELVAPDRQFPLQLSNAQTAFYPMPEAAYKDLDAYDRMPIGNGPFKMDEAWKDNTEFSVSANKDYAGTAPSLDRVTFRSYKDMDTAYTDALAGNVDLLAVPDNKLTSTQDDFGDRVHALEAPAVDWLGFPVGDPRFADIRVRQAISMSIDRDAVNKAIFGGLYKPATALTAPSMPGTPADACGKYCKFDPEAARKLLAEAGGFQGTMKLVFPGGNGYDSLFEAYANQIRQNLGIKEVVAAPTTDWAEFFDALDKHTVAGPFRGHWGALYPSQQNTLRNLFTKGGKGARATGFYTNPKVDALLAEGDAATSFEQANERYAAAQEVILNDFPTVPTFSSPFVYATSKKITSLPSVSGNVLLSKVGVAKK
ncbi:ABC transporter substrate-binding protein [Arthrobacter sp. GMC3]|uniref:peptide ABC transporter substrate-binding protein n=1 Tax=Arthrobacter sp. GMC3 TaxID=2058894 RepID=UPI000CE4E47F|nr:ABC transporter substrate-binding protein [Arthrobacter sp. GMC3]